MRQRFDAVPEDLRAVAMAAQSEQITFLAAAVAYYAFVSLIPLSLLGLVIASVMGGAVFEGQIMTTASEFLTPDAQSLLTEALSGESGRGGATIVGTVVLLWSGLRLFRGLDKAFSQVYGTIGSKTFVNELINAVVVSLAIVVGVASMTVVGAAIDRLPAGDLAPQIGFALLVATLAVVFYPMYLLLPDTNVDYREAAPGTLFASLGWVLLGAGFQLYSANAGNFAAYGVLGGVLLLVTWLYFGALIVMMGAVVNAVLADRLDAEAAAAMDYEPGYAPGDHDRQEMASSVGESPSRAEVADVLGDPESAAAGSEAREARDRAERGSAADEGIERRTGEQAETDRQVQRDGVRQTDTTEAMTGEDSPDRQDDDDESPSAAFGAGPETGSNGPEAGSNGTETGSNGAETGDGGPETGSNGRETTDGGPRAAADGSAEGPTASERVRPGTAPASEVARLNSEIADLRSELDEFENRVDDRTVDRDEFESDVKRYVRRRVRRGHARGWGPYLVLLYGTAMTIGAFYFLDAGWSILAMIVVWLSTLGLYVLMVLVGAGLSLLGVPGRVRNTIGSWRS